MKGQLTEIRENLRRCEDDLESHSRAITMLESEKLDLMEVFFIYCLIYLLLFVKLLSQAIRDIHNLYPPPLHTIKPVCFFVMKKINDLLGKMFENIRETLPVLFSLNFLKPLNSKI